MFKFIPKAAGNRGLAKGRTIDIVTPEIDRFYESSSDALLNYIKNATEVIEVRNFMGKHAPKASSLDAISSDGLYSSLFNQDSASQSIGALVDDLRSKGIVRGSKQVNELSDVLRAYFFSTSTSTSTAVIKELTNVYSLSGLGSGINLALKRESYLAPLAPVEKAIIQFKDLIKTFDQNGLFNTIATTMKSNSSELKPINVRDLGINLLFHEEISKGVLKTVQDTALLGFSALDRSMKNIFMKSSYMELKSSIQNGKPEKAMKKLLDTIDEESAKMVIDEIKQGVIGFETKLYLIQHLAQVQPIIKGNLTEGFLTGGQFAKLAYQYKTYAIMHLDYMKEQVLRRSIKEIAAVEGKAAKTAKFAEIIATRLMPLLLGATAIGVTVDQQKEVLSGKTSSVLDKIKSNAIELSGVVNPYSVWKIQRDGLIKGGIETYITPPSFSSAIKAADAVGKAMGDTSYEITVGGEKSKGRGSEGRSSKGRGETKGR